MMEKDELREKIKSMKASGALTREDAITFVCALPDNGIDPEERCQIVDLVYKSVEIPTVAAFNLTDSGSAEYIVELHGYLLKYDHLRQRWLIWDGVRWKPDTNQQVMRLALAATRKRYKDAVNIPDLEQRKAVSTWAISSEQKSRLEACLGIAKALEPIADNGEDWDTDPWLFCVKNGVVDLRTGELRQGKQGDRITMQSPVHFDPEAKCPRWMRFLEQVTGGHVELQDYLQIAAGYSLTGETKAQIWFFLYGLGSNGKTSFTMAIRRLMGDYGIRLDSDDLMVKDKKSRGSSPKEGLADTRGKRFAIASEVQDGKRLDIGLLKDMTGQDTIKARRLYEHEVEFIATHKLWMFGNHKPTITDTTNAAWRRLKLIPFTVTIPDSEIDPDLQTKLEGELPGILNWALEGCLKWQREGFSEPPMVADAVASYRHESDILSDFIEDSCVLEPLGTIDKAEMKELYHEWCKENGQEPVSQLTFKKRLNEKGITERRSGSRGRYWVGIRKALESDKTSGDFETKVTKLHENTKSPPMKDENSGLYGKTVSFDTFVTDGTENQPDIPPCPTTPCHICGCELYHLNAAGDGWVCDRCHPEAQP